MFYLLLIFRAASRFWKAPMLSWFLIQERFGLLLRSWWKSSIHRGNYPGATRIRMKGQDKRKEIKPLNHFLFFRFWRNSQSLACVFRVGLVMDEFPPRSSCISRHGRSMGASQRVSLMFKISFGSVFLSSANFQPRSKGSFHFWSWKPSRKQRAALGVRAGTLGERTLVLADMSVGADEVVSWTGASCPRVHIQV